MGDFGSIDEVLEFAIDREIEANQLYKDLAKMVKNKAMRKVFVNFAKEELGHKAKLEAMKKSQVTVTTEKVADLKIADSLINVEPTADMDYRDAIALAIQKENASFCLYTDLADIVENSEQREIFLSLAHEEAKHKLRFEVEYDEMVLKEN